MFKLILFKLLLLLRNQDEKKVSGVPSVSSFPGIVYYFWYILPIFFSTIISQTNILPWIWFSLSLQKAILLSS